MATFPSDSIRTKTWGTELLTSSDLHAQLDVIHNYIKALLDSSSGHDHSGTSNQSKKISPANLLIASQAQGDTLYASSASAWARLAKGTAAQLLAMNAGATAPEWKSYSDYATAANALAGSIVQVVNTTSATYTSCTTAIPFDDTVPQNTEGDEILTLAITPKATTNKLIISVQVNGGNSTSSYPAIALFQDTTAGALATQWTYANAQMARLTLTHYMAAGTTSATTFKVRAGASAGTFGVNGDSSARKFGGVSTASITIFEVKV